MPHGEVNEELLCPICKDVLYRPLVLACGHSVDESPCYRLLHDHYSNCPVCRKPIDYDKTPGVNFALQVCCFLSLLLCADDSLL